MDQIRTILKVIWQQRFWVLSCIGTILALYFWSSASGQLDSEFSKRKSAISGRFTAIQNLNNQNIHPNESVIEDNTKQTEEEAKITLAIWEDLYGRQRDEVLFWPKDNLDAGFIEEIEKLKFGDSFPSRKAQAMRNNYWNYIEKRFDGLVEIVKALKIEGKGRSSRGGGEYGGDEYGGGYGGGYGSRGLAISEDEEQDYLVQWLDQGKLQSQLQFKKKQTALEIWVTQENLWVYETLLHVIANTNKARGATRPDNTAVLAIVNLEVGRDAVTGSKKSGTLVKPSAAGNTGAAYGGGYGRGGGGEEYGGEYGGGEYGGGEYGLGGSGGEYGSEGGGEADTEALAFRYLDSSTGEPYPGDSADFGIEFRQLPVRMVLMMDQTWIPHILVECANATLPIEIKKLRINPDQSGTGFGKSGSRGTRGRIKGLEGLDKNSAVVQVELQGVVYIYNEPDKSQLGIPDESEEQDQFADIQ